MPFAAVISLADPAVASLGEAQTCCDRCAVICFRQTAAPHPCRRSPTRRCRRRRRRSHPCSSHGGGRQHAGCPPAAVAAPRFCGGHTGGGAADRRRARGEAKWGGGCDASRRQRRLAGPRLAALPPDAASLAPGLPPCRPAPPHWPPARHPAAGAASLPGPHRRCTIWGAPPTARRPRSCSTGVNTLASASSGCTM